MSSAGVQDFFSCKARRKGHNADVQRACSSNAEKRGEDVGREVGFERYGSTEQAEDGRAAARHGGIDGTEVVELLLKNQTGRFS